MNVEVEQTEPSSTPRRWTTAVVGVAVIAAVGLISQGVSTNSTNVPVSTLAQFEEQRLDEQIPDFTGTLHVTLSLNRVPTYAQWAADAVIPELFELDTQGMTLNVDLSQVATIDLLGRDVGDLRVGQPGSTRAVTPDVTSFVWHDARPESIALTRTLFDTSLWVAEVDPVFGFRISSQADLDRGSEVVAYGEWGFALHTAPDADGNLTTIILNQDFEETARINGEVVGSVPGLRGGVMIADPLGSDVATTWAEDVLVVDSVLGLEGLLRALWSEDLLSYAELTDGDQPGIDILYVRRGDSTYTFEGYEPIVWDSSGRLLATIRQQQIVIIDVTDGQRYDLGIPRAIVSDIRFSD